MPAPAPHEEQDSFREFLSVLGRRKLVVFLALVLTPLGAFAYSLLQDPRHEATAAVLATTGGVAQGLSEIPGFTSAEDPERYAATQVTLARLPKIAERVISTAPLFEDPQDFLDRSSVTAQTDADILRFSVVDADADESIRLATIYAQEFTQYRNDLDLDAIRSTRSAITRRMASLAAAGRRDSALYEQLSRAVRQLDAAEALQGSAAILVQPAITSQQVQPQMKRNLALGIVLGLLLGIGLAFLVERLDTRVRSPEEAEALLGLPVLGELSPPPPLPKSAKTLVSMLDFPWGPYAEGVRKLRSNVEFANLDVGARVLMVTSAVGGEGKTTVACDLAVALARSGRTVALCDLDPRAPSVHRAFGLGERSGLVEVAFGIDSLQHALVKMHLETPERPSRARSSTLASWAEVEARPPDDGVVQPRGVEVARGHVDVLTLGRRHPPNPADFVGSTIVRQIVAELAQTHEFVILDTAPLLPVSDSLTISEYVDAALVVCGLQTSRRPTLRRLRKVISTFTGSVLGIVVTGVPEQPGYGPYFVGPPPAARQPRMADL